MATPGDRLVDAVVNHRVGLNRYSTHVVRRILAQLNRTELDILARLVRTSNETVSGTRLEALLAEIRAIQTQGWAVVRERMGEAVADLAGAEAEFITGLVERMAGPAARPVPFATLPTQAHIVAAVQARPFQGRFLRDWLAEAEEGAAKRVRETIRQGFIEGETTDQIVRRIRGTKAARYKDGILEVNRRGAEAMVRTALTHTSAVATKESYAMLGVERVRFVATLDHRTTLTCASLHNKVFPLEKFPWPPRHVNCRSTSIPVVDLPGLESPEAPSYNAWLRRQPASVQDDILGKAKGRLFRSGGLDVDRFVDNKGRTLTLDELRRRDASAFEAAGIE